MKKKIKWSNPVLIKLGPFPLDNLEDRALSIERYTNSCFHNGVGGSISSCTDGNVVAFSNPPPGKVKLGIKSLFKIEK